jgi:hypothetical protein
MWIYLNDSFLSIVRHRDKPQFLMVRARREGDIEKVFPDATVERTPTADYHYRTTLHEHVVSGVMSARIENIDYDNFKDSVEDKERSDVYHQLWAVSLRLSVSGGWGEAMYNKDHFKAQFMCEFNAEEVERNILNTEK